MDEKTEYTGYEKLLRDILDQTKRKDNTDAKAVRDSFRTDIAKTIDTLAKLRNLSGGDCFEDAPVDRLSIAYSEAFDKIIDGILDNVVNDILLCGMPEQDRFPF